jgi:preprotein translocase subunit SecE
VAESNRRGKRAADDRLDDEVFADAVDDDALDDDFDTDVVDDDLDEELVTAGRTRGGRAGTVTKSAKGATTGRTATTAKAAGKGKDERPNIFERIARFIREVVAEMRKVNWPSRKELLTYTSVVLVFVIVMMSIVGVLDYAFAWAVGHVFAGGK